MGEKVCWGLYVFAGFRVENTNYLDLSGNLHHIGDLRWALPILTRLKNPKVETVFGVGCGLT